MQRSRRLQSLERIRAGLASSTVQEKIGFPAKSCFLSEPLRVVARHARQRHLLTTDG
jgi:hypothetical protein